MKHQELSDRATRIAQSYRRCEKELLEIISLIDQKKAFQYFGYSSLFAYVTRELKISEAIAYNFITVARKSHQVPALKDLVLRGEISVHKARKLTPVIDADNQGLWLERAKTLTQKQLEREVALASPRHAVPELTKYVSKNNEVKESVRILRQIPRIQLQLGLDEKTMIALRRGSGLRVSKTKKKR